MLDLTSLLRLYAKYRVPHIERLDVCETQGKLLLRLLNKAKNTKFGKEYGFSDIRSVAEYQRRVPLRDYDAFWEEWLREPFPNVVDVTWPGKLTNFVISSGTTSGITKYLPFTREMIASNRKAGIDLLCFHLMRYPRSKLLGGLSFVLLGSSVLDEQAPGVKSGDLSDTMMSNLPLWIQSKYYPLKELRGIPDWESRIDALARDSLKRDIRMLSGVPSWMLIFFEKLKEVAPEGQGKIKDWYPNLEMLVHGGMRFEPYKKLFLEALEGSNAELREVYPASEAFIAIQDQGHGDGMRICCDHGVFFEFVPLEELGSSQPTRCWLADVEPDVNYAVVLTNSSGLWSYLIGDTVKFVETRPPRVLITGRTSYMLSAFGEHLIEAEIQEGVRTAADALQLEYCDFSVGAVFPNENSKLGGHLYVIEFIGEGPTGQRLQEFSRKLDEKLCELNDDYKAHRAEGYGLRSPEVIVADPGTFKEWMKKRGKLGGQNKVPRVINDESLFGDLVSFTKHQERL